MSATDSDSDNTPESRPFKCCSDGADGMSKVAASIDKLGQKFLDVSRFEADSRMDIARMEVESRVNMHRLESVRQLTISVSKVRGEKRQLLNQLGEHQHKKNKVMIESVKRQLEDIEEDARAMQKQLDKLQSKNEEE